ncbi:MAG: sodium ion-translocating decarboxylase subunit beta [Clostridia bacterium]
MIKSLLLESTGILDSLYKFWSSTGLANADWKNYVMILVALVLLYLAIRHKCEPMLLLPIAFGMLLINMPLGHDILFKEPSTTIINGVEQIQAGGLFYYFYQGVQLVIFPPLIFLGIGVMTDFGPLISRPSSLLLGAAAQLGIFVTFLGAKALGFTNAESSAIGIIGGADGPTAIFLTSKLAQHLLPAVAIAAYSYMALIPFIQPPIMKMLTTRKERLIKMEQKRVVSKTEKIIFPIAVTIVCGLILPEALPLIGMLMLGNLMRESGVVDRLSKTAENGLMNTITILLGLAVGCKAYGETFLQWETLKIIALGLVAFSVATMGGLLVGKLMCKLSGGKINPLIGAAGVSAVPMAARVVQNVAQKEDPQNYLLMHAMGPNVAGVIGSAVAAGMLLSIFGA